MHIKWVNMIVAVLAVISLIVLVAFQSEIVGFLAQIDDIGSGHSMEEQVRGLLAFGLVAVTLVAITRIVCSRDRGDH